MSRSVIDRGVEVCRQGCQVCAVDRSVKVCFIKEFGFTEKVFQTQGFNGMCYKSRVQSPTNCDKKFIMCICWNETLQTSPQVH